MSEIRCPMCGSERTAVERRPNGYSICITCHCHWKTEPTPPKPTNIYRVQRTDKCRWKQYDSFIVVSKDEVTARYYHPSSGAVWNPKTEKWITEKWVTEGTWTKPSNLTVKLIGKTIEPMDEGTIICASFNAG